MRRYRRRHSNPLGSINSTVKDALIPGAIGAAGAAVLDWGMGILAPNLPSQLQTQPFNAIVQLGGAIGLGALAGRFMGREKGQYVMLGGVIVVGYNFLKGMLSSSGITLPGLAGYADYTPYKLGAYMRGATGTPGIQGLGYVSPAAVVGPTLSPRMGAYMQPMNVAPAMGDYGDGM
jgi:hypothetical protein